MIKRTRGTLTNSSIRSQILPKSLVPWVSVTISLLPQSTPKAGQPAKGERQQQQQHQHQEQQQWQRAVMHSRYVRGYHAACSPTYQTQLFPRDNQRLQWHQDTRSCCFSMNVLHLLHYFLRASIIMAVLS